ncbi:hypothetical protein L195_g005530 [Trifolium pratense]|uniref:Basic 7S globulin n=1 Tax=Trifolium pratense TaxID=57577 RepID=A0A2K3NU63_TRIPR|nr:basic 7S globulin [Trifolium pratense]PNY08545.1 hypothetical protein L195_g005072 [Trifolium pratense]PNY08988.1 hypothetical protein L195_g005530 [Trifolium pratense]
MTMTVNTKPREIEKDKDDSNKQEQMKVKQYPPNISTPKVAPITSVGHTGCVCRISKENLMVKAQHGDTYLDLLDGRLLPRSAAAIGAQHSRAIQQLEDNLVQFYLATSSLGSSSSLIVHRTKWC